MLQLPARCRPARRDVVAAADGKTHKVEADVGTLRQIVTRLKAALQDGSGFHMRRCSQKLQRARMKPLLLTFTAQGAALRQMTAAVWRAW